MPRSRKAAPSGRCLCTSRRPSAIRERLDRGARSPSREVVCGAGCRPAVTEVVTAVNFRITSTYAKRQRAERTSATGFGDGRKRGREACSDGGADRLFHPLCASNHRSMRSRSSAGSSLITENIAVGPPLDLRDALLEPQQSPPSHEARGRLLPRRPRRRQCSTGASSP